MPRRDAPQLFVQLLNEGGEPVRVASDEVLSFEYTDRDRKADRVRLVVDNSDIANFDDPAWRKGAKIRVRWGYPGNMAPARTAVITGVRGFLELTIEALAESVLMNRETKTRVFENATRSEVVRSIAEENGWGADVSDIDETTERFEVISQPRLTDAQMIRRLAAREGFEFYVDNDGFHWHARRLDQRPVRTFRYYTDREGEIIGEPTIENDITAKPGAVRVQGRDSLNRTDIDARANNVTDESRSGLGGILDLIDFETGETAEQYNAAQEETRPTSAPTQEAAEAEARARYRRAQQVAIKMGLQVVGDPQLLAKTVCQIEGMGRRLSVRYYIEECAHTFGTEGYVCNLKLISDGHGGHDTSSRAAQGLELVEVGPASRATRNEEDADDANDGDAAGSVTTGEDPGPLHSVELIDFETGESATEWRQTPSRGRS